MQSGMVTCAPRDSALTPFLAALVLGAAASAYAQTVLPAVDCTAQPAETSQWFQWPVSNVGQWDVTYNLFQVFDDVTGQYHTGIDMQDTRDGGQDVFAAGTGVVLWAGAYPVNRVGGYVLVRHLAAVQPFQITAKQATRSEFSYPASESRDVLTVYLHLDPSQIQVVKGQNVRRGDPIGRLYTRDQYCECKKAEKDCKCPPDSYQYPPHLHFEVWKHCTDVDRNGYDTPEQFQGRQSTDPTAFMSHYVENVLGLFDAGGWSGAGYVYDWLPFVPEVTGKLTKAVSQVFECANGSCNGPAYYVICAVDGGHYNGCPSESLLATSDPSYGYAWPSDPPRSQEFSFSGTNAITLQAGASYFVRPYICSFDYCVGGGQALASGIQTFYGVNTQ